MNAALTPWMAMLIAFCIGIETAREICFRKAAEGNDFAVVIRQPLTWLGIGFWAIELVAWARVLEQVPLGIAFPLAALSYVTIVMAAAWLFKEPVNLRHACGALLITAGVACVGATGL